MIENSFSIQAVITQGVHLFRAYWKKVVIAQLLVVVIGFISGIAFVSPIVLTAFSGKRVFSPISIAIFVVIGILLILVLAYFMFGYARLMFRLASGERASVREIFKAPREQFVQYFKGKLITFLLLLVGFILLVIPGIIVAIGLSMFTFVFFDKNTKAVEALKTSWAITKGHRVNIFLFGLVVAVASFIVGLIPVLGSLISAFVVSPIAFFAMFAIYRFIMKMPVPTPVVPTTEASMTPSLEVPKEV